MDVSIMQADMALLVWVARAAAAGVVLDKKVFITQAPEVPTLAAEAEVHVEILTRVKVGPVW